MIQMGRPNGCELTRRLGNNVLLNKIINKSKVPLLSSADKRSRVQ
jgi:hypothetical protein